MEVTSCVHLIRVRVQTIVCYTVFVMLEGSHRPLADRASVYAATSCLCMYPMCASVHSLLFQISNSCSHLCSESISDELFDLQSHYFSWCARGSYWHIS